MIQSNPPETNPTDNATIYFRFIVCSRINYLFYYFFYLQYPLLFLRALLLFIFPYKKKKKRRMNFEIIPQVQQYNYLSPWKKAIQNDYYDFFSIFKNK